MLESKVRRLKTSLGRICKFWIKENPASQTLHKHKWPQAGRVRVEYKTA